MKQKMSKIGIFILRILIILPAFLTFNESENIGVNLIGVGYIVAVYMLRNTKIAQLINKLN